jgi:transcriptional regulator with GAF, ATPase, and Fis domain
MFEAHVKRAVLLSGSGVTAIAELTRDRDAWKALALQAIAVLEAKPLDIPANWPGRHVEQVRDISTRLIQQAVDAHGGNKLATSRFLGISNATVHYAMHRNDVTEPDDEVVSV